MADSSSRHMKLTKTEGSGRDGRDGNPHCRTVAQYYQPMSGKDDVKGLITSLNPILFSRTSSPLTLTTFIDFFRGTTGMETFQ